MSFEHDIPPWLTGAGEMRRLVRTRDWSRYALGPVDAWPRSLVTSLGIVLSSRFSMILWWGPEFRIFYNDAYAPTLGIKHPAALGEPGAYVWEEIWPVIGPMLQHVAQSGEATWSEDQQFFLLRSGYTEETYHTFSYSPVWGESGDVAGVFCAVTESTKRVLSDRRLKALRDVGALTPRARRVDAACLGGLEAMRACGPDASFAMIYLRDARSPGVLRRKAVLNIDAVSPMAPAALTDNALWPAFQALEEKGIVELPLSAAHRQHVPDNIFHERPLATATLPIGGGEGTEALGVMVVGLNSRRAFDDDYRAFLQLIAGQLATAVAKTRALEEEQRRAELLAELNQAKTLFFSNVSHEFRTPLTLMLGPLEELLRRPEALPSEARTELGLVHRNALRLLKLVNTLLDFARMEAGRAEAVFEPCAMGELTRDLASAFRSAVEHAGMQYTVDVPDVSDDVYVDRDMWEKIVLNLLSNAFKYTMAGHITVTQRLTETSLRLTVEDTGCGIPAAEIPRLFERFHRVAGAKGRTDEGTGIGLALVQELVKLHGGAITVESQQDRGSRFTVEIPRGRAHLPAQQVAGDRTLASTAVMADAYVQEASRWLPAELSENAYLASSPGSKTTVVLADDNADMLTYLSALLAPHYEVYAVNNGAEALAAARTHHPDVIISDIMMPVLDGLQLVHAVRADPALHTTPIILLSARAGEEARVDGLHSGADDYLVKPFSAREFLARVLAYVKMATLRREAASEQSRLLERERAAVRYRDEFMGIASHELRTPITSMRLQLQLTERVLAHHHGHWENVPHERLQKMVRVFSRQIRNLGALVDDLLDVSRIANGHLTIEPESTDLPRLVREVIEQTHEQMDSAGCEVTLEAEENLRGMWDPKRLEQVVVNLLGNAAKYAAGKPVKVTVEGNAKTATITVRDEGRGIAPADQEKVFNRFERAVSRTKISGLGLGLYIVKEIVDAHHGHVHLTSEVGKGSAFMVELPRRHPD